MRTSSDMLSPIRRSIVMRLCTTLPSLEIRHWHKRVQFVH